MTGGGNLRTRAEMMSDPERPGLADAILGWERGETRSTPTSTADGLKRSSRTRRRLGSGYAWACTRLDRGVRL